MMNQKLTKSASDQLFKYRHRIIFPGRRQPSIFIAYELNFRVRNGNGCDLIAIYTDLSILETYFTE